MPIDHVATDVRLRRFACSLSGVCSTASDCSCDTGDNGRCRALPPPLGGPGLADGDHERLARVAHGRDGRALTADVVAFRLRNIRIQDAHSVAQTESGVAL